MSVFLVKTTFSQQINFGDESNFDKNISNEFEFKIFPDDQENKWKNIFKNKNFIEVSSFFNNLPLNSRDEVVQNIIFDILSSTKSFDDKLLSSPARLDQSGVRFQPSDPLSKRSLMLSCSWVGLRMSFCLSASWLSLHYLSGGKPFFRVFSI